MRQLSTLLFVSVAFSILAPALARQTPANHLADLNSLNAPPGTRDAAAELFPKLAAMTAPPDSPGDLRQVSLLCAGGAATGNWAAWAEWAKSQPQQDVLAALKAVTDPAKKYALSLPYGRDGVDPAWISADLFVELGSPPLLAMAPAGAKYLSRLDVMAKLLTVEAARLAFEKKPDEALTVLINWVRLGRMIADRQFANEKLWGMRQVREALERMRDIAVANPGLFTEKHAQEAAKELDLRAIAPERVRFPEGERRALLQIVDLTMEPRGNARAEAFGPTLGRITAEGRALNLFPQAAYWGQVGETHAGYFDTLDQIKKVFGDWQHRWDLNNIFDPLMRDASDFSGMDRAKFAIIDQVALPVTKLYGLRTLMVTDLGATRAGMGVIGFRSAQGQWPPGIEAVQPRFVAALDYDPWYFEPNRQVRQVYRYFVPMRDTPLGPRELPKAHSVTVSGSIGAAAPTAPLSHFTEDEWQELRAFQSNGVPDSTEMPKGGASKAEEFYKKGGVEPVPPNAATTPMPRIMVKLLKLPSDAKDSIAQHWTDWVKNIIAAPEHIEELRKLDALDKITSADMWERMRAGIERVADRILGPVSAPQSSPSSGQPAAPDPAAEVIKVTNVTRYELLRQAFAGGVPGALYDPATDKIDAGAVKSFLKNQMPNMRILESEKKAFEEFITKLDDDTMLNLMRAVRGSGAAVGGDSFTIELTDADFVIYSVGANGRNDYAGAVGEGGSDILLWPPILNLERRAAPK